MATYNDVRAKIASSSRADWLKNHTGDELTYKGALHIPNYAGNYWCYMPENGTWKPVSPNWQSGTGFSPGEFPD